MGNKFAIQSSLAEKVLSVLDKEQFKSFGGDSHWEGVLIREALEELNEDSENDTLVEKTTKEVHDMIYNSKRVSNTKKFAISSARGEVSDSTRQLVRDILAQVPALVKVPAKQQGIKKEPYGPDHVCYFYTEEGPRKGSYVTVEVHVDPSDLYSDIFITTRASFAAAAEGEEARQDEREITLDEFVIEDLEDYSLADIDRIDAAVTKGFEGAQKFDELGTSSIESRKALFSSRHRRFVNSGMSRGIPGSPFKSADPVFSYSFHKSYHSDYWNGYANNYALEANVRGDEQVLADYLSSANIHYSKAPDGSFNIATAGDDARQLNILEFLRDNGFSGTYREINNVADEFIPTIRQAQEEADVTGEGSLGEEGVLRKEKNNTYQYYQRSRPSVIWIRGITADELYTDPVLGTLVGLSGLGNETFGRIEDWD